MSESFYPNDEAETFAGPLAELDDRRRRRALLLDGPVESLTGHNEERLAARRLSTELAHITARLLQQLSTAGELIPDAEGS
jgi:hypothetical protein